ncbi:MAG: hypothetical protein NT150_09720 [Bacteroidetes bacterium]|nr:hypothetical protein [Bacteroidota bacterium]
MYARYPHSLIVSFLLLFAVSAYSQQTINTQVVAKRSYGMYLKHQWPELIAYGDSVLKLGFDYYYIRMRMGIAYYELKKFREAEPHFKKAIEFNSGEDLAYEYLYYIYVFTDRFEESRKWTERMSPVLKSKLKTDSLPVVDLMEVEAGGKVSSYSNVPNASFFQVGLNHYVGNKFSLFHSYTYYGQSNSYWGVSQHQYYLGASVPLKNNWQFSPSLHYIYRSTTVSSASTSGYNFVGSAMATKHLKKIDASFGSTVLWLDSVYQFQHNAALTYFPLGNNKLGIGAAVYGYTQDAYSSFDFVYVPFVSYKPNAKLSLFTSYLVNTGDHNIAEWNGYLVNNSPDFTSGKFTLNAEYNINRRFSLSGTYQYESMYSTYYKSDYQFNSFYIGLKFKP